MKPTDLYGMLNLWRIPMQRNPCQQAGETITTVMSDLEALRRISAYIAENKINSALEAEEEKMATEAAKLPVPEEVILAVEPKPPDKSKLVNRSVDEQCLDCIYDDEPLGFEKDPMAQEKMQPQDPLEEIDLGERVIKDQPTLAPTSTKSSGLR